MSETRLFWYPGTCSRVVYVALKEIGEPFELTLVDRFGSVPDGEPYELLRITEASSVDPEYATINPKGKVPSLIIDGRTITENPAIHTYLNRRHPEVGLLPGGDQEIEALETMSWFAAGVHPAITRQRFPHITCNLEESHACIRAHARKVLERCFSLIEDRLDDREWLFGDWSIVDVYLLWLWFRATGGGLDGGMDGSKFPRCADHATRCESRPTLAQVLDHEEREFGRLEDAGRVPSGVPPYHAGRAPTF